jgi:hypothetical protein
MTLWTSALRAKSVPMPVDCWVLYKTGAPKQACLAGIPAAIAEKLDAAAENASR